MIGRWTVWTAFMLGWVVGWGTYGRGAFTVGVTMAVVWLGIESWIHFRKQER